ncbi:hypothetical protein CSUB01_01212 [Colletotrichum sublineola]|uniref:Uncharacterized protein n=1 Tax=Colletotrichum sublineola TaxID=1173701 RepID=A0A066XJ80_COLSU|nr:hypothetical protein CSUB01_01212 [Colletotrichum sublineola]
MRQQTVTTKATAQRAVTPMSWSTQATWQSPVAAPKAAAAENREGSAFAVQQGAPGNFDKDQTAPLDVVAIDRPWNRDQKVRQIHEVSVLQTVNERVQDPIQYWLREASVDQPYNAVGEVKMPLQNARSTWPGQVGRDISPTRATASGSEMYQSGSR